jgi:hypothetical protein
MKLQIVEVELTVALTMPSEENDFVLCRGWLT